jgi:hypothetical protein
LEYKLDLIAKALDVYRIETVTAVVRRQHANDDGEVVDVIDLYPEWNQQGTYGKMKVAHEYLDHDWQRQRFEKFAGVTVDQLPIYEGQQAMQRRFGMNHKCEVAVRPFRLMLQPRKDENGNYDKTLILRYLPGQQRPSNRQTPPAAQQPPAPPAAAPNGNGRSDGHRNGNGRSPQPPPPPPPTQQTTAEWWELAAAEPTTPAIFDTKFAEADRNYNDGDHVAKFRQLLFGDWHNGRARAYARGLKKYGELRSDGRKHSEAKTEALNRYHRELKEMNHAYAG